MLTTGGEMLLADEELADDEQRDAKRLLLPGIDPATSDRSPQCGPCT